MIKKKTVKCFTKKLVRLFNLDVDYQEISINVKKLQEWTGRSLRGKSSFLKRVRKRLLVQLGTESHLVMCVVTKTDVIFIRCLSVTTYYEHNVFIIPRFDKEITVNVKEDAMGMLSYRSVEIHTVK